MYNRQFHHQTNTLSREAFSKPSLTEPDNAMSIPEIIARYTRGHGLSVQVLPDTSDQAALEDGQSWIDDPDMFSEERQAAMQRDAAPGSSEQPSSAASGEPASSEAPATT